LYVAGAEILQNYAVGPLAGVAYNLTLLSYNHSLDMGVNIDTAAVTDPAGTSHCPMSRISIDTRPLPRSCATATVA
jgi:hypothetical protein